MYLYFPETSRTFYEHGRYHEMSLRMQNFCTTKLPCSGTRQNSQSEIILHDTRSVSCIHTVHFSQWRKWEMVGAATLGVRTIQITFLL